MAFTKSGGSRSYLKYADFDEGEVLVEGWYVGEETSKFKNQLYVFRQKEDDSIVCLNATGKLTKWIENNIETGDLVQIIYQGKKVISQGVMAGKEAHDFEFGIDLEYRKSQARVDATINKEVPKAKFSSKQVDSAMDEGIL